MIKLALYITDTFKMARRMDLELKRLKINLCMEIIAMVLNKESLEELIEFIFGLNVNLKMINLLGL